jgi:DNA-nicking Smr family endonuclease
MDHKAHRKLTRGRLTPEARIDLHGMTLAEAHPELIRFILRAQDTGLRLVLVITGKGRLGADDGPIPMRHGLLRHQVPLWLHQAPLGAVVLQVAQAHLKHGGAGAYYVYLRRSR